MEAEAIQVMNHQLSSLILQLPVKPVFMVNMFVVLYITQVIHKRTKQVIILSILMLIYRHPRHINEDSLWSQDPSSQSLHSTSNDTASNTTYSS